MSIRVFGVLLSTLFFPALLAAQPVSFQICAESTTWVRPSPEVQAKVWNMPRYDASDRTATAWTHDFIVDYPESASIAYDLMNLSGLWTAPLEAFNKCREKTGPNGYQWIEAWVLLYRVKEITLADNTYTITIEPTGKGFQSIFIRRLNPSAVFRFVTPDGKELDRWETSPTHPPRPVR
jgi:hypothetical protein